MNSKDKFNILYNGVYNKSEFYNLKTLISDCDEYVWEEPEWGFRR